MSRVQMFLAVAILFLGGSVLADEGRVPLEALGIGPPYTITQPGSYIVTRDHFVVTGDIVLVQANDVTLDLNQKVLSSESAGEGASGTIITLGAPFSGLTVRNGKITGGGCAICAPGATTATRLSVHGIQVENSFAGIDAAGASLILRDSSLQATYSGVVAGNGVVIVGNQIEVRRQVPTSTSFGVGVGSGVIEANILMFPGMYDGWGLQLQGSGTVVRGNSLFCPGCNDTTGISVGSHNVIVENALHGFGNDGIVVGGGNLVRGNTISDDGDANHGIWVTGTGSRIEGNVVRGGREGGIELGSGNSCIGNHVDVRGRGHRHWRGQLKSNRR